MRGDWNLPTGGNHRDDDGPEAMREWRWRCYTDHLEDLGYDLDSGETPDAERGEVPEMAHSMGGLAPSTVR